MRQAISHANKTAEKESDGRKLRLYSHNDVHFPIARWYSDPTGVGSFRPARVKNQEFASECRGCRGEPLLQGIPGETLISASTSPLPWCRSEHRSHWSTPDQVEKRPWRARINDSSNPGKLSAIDNQACSVRLFISLKHKSNFSRNWWHAKVSVATQSTPDPSALAECKCFRRNSANFSTWQLCAVPSNNPCSSMTNSINNACSTTCLLLKPMLLGHSHCHPSFTRLIWSPFTWCWQVLTCIAASNCSHRGQK